MTDHEYELRLAEYLGGEMNGADRRAFETQVAPDPMRQAELESLKSALHQLRALPDMAEDQAAAASATLKIRQRGGRLSRGLLGLTRYAAVLVVGILAGSRLATPPLPTQETGDVKPVNISKEPVPALPEHWEQLAIDSDRLGAAGATLAGQLQVLYAARRASVR